MLQIQANVVKQMKMFSKRYSLKEIENILRTTQNVIRTKQNAHKKKLFRNKYSIKIF